MRNLEPFSVILPVYRNDNAAHLVLAIDSLLNQDYAPQEIIIIEDGPVTEELRSVIDNFVRKASTIHNERLDKNAGLPSALNRGIEVASHEWIARMDADDICKADRFKTQFTYLKAHPDIDIIGSWIDEYDEEMDEFIGCRKLPETHKRILRYAKWRCPFNHMTVVYRKSMMQKLGSYRVDLPGNAGEDYELWARILTNGYKAANIQSVLVDARTGSDFFEKRRRGTKYLKNEYKAIKAIRQTGLIGWPETIVHWISKTIIRLAPAGFVKGFYNLIRSSS